MFGRRFCVNSCVHNVAERSPRHRGRVSHAKTPTTWVGVVPLSLLPRRGSEETHQDHERRHASGGTACQDRDAAEALEWPGAGLTAGAPSGAGSRSEGGEEQDESHPAPGRAQDGASDARQGRCAAAWQEPGRPTCLCQVESSGQADSPEDDQACAGRQSEPPGPCGAGPGVPPPSPCCALRACARASWHAVRMTAGSSWAPRSSSSRMRWGCSRKRDSYDSSARSTSQSASLLRRLSASRTRRRFAFSYGVGCLPTRRAKASRRSTSRSAPLASAVAFTRPAPRRASAPHRASAALLPRGRSFSAVSMGRRSVKRSSATRSARSGKRTERPPRASIISRIFEPL